MSDADDTTHAACHGCGGSGRVNKPRLFLSVETEEPFTALEAVPCPYCRDDPGHMPGIVPPT